jgi:predicted  nucleic acid-binding Zn-ribbon protein
MNATQRKRERQALHKARRAAELAQRELQAARETVQSLVWQIELTQKRIAECEQRTCESIMDELSTEADSHRASALKQELVLRRMQPAAWLRQRLVQLEAELARAQTELAFAGENSAGQPSSEPNCGASGQVGCSDNTQPKH